MLIVSFWLVGVLFIDGEKAVFFLKMHSLTFPCLFLLVDLVFQSVSFQPSPVRSNATFNATSNATFHKKLW